MRAAVPPPLVALVAGVAMWGTARALPAWHFTGSWQRPLAAALVAAAGILMTAAVAALVRARTTINPLRPERASALVTGGAFRWSRNPIYLADLLLLAAWAVWLGQPVNVLWLGAFVAWLNRFQIVPEEKALAANFGAHYAAYRTRVRRWL